MLRVEYGSAGVGRTRFVSSPVTNLIVAFHLNQPDKKVRPGMDRWWQDARRHIPDKARPLLGLINACPHYLPALLAPEVPVESVWSRRSLDDELDALRAVSEDRIAVDLANFEALGVVGKESRIVAELRDEGVSLIPDLVDAVQGLFKSCFEPDWPDLHRRIETEIAIRGRQMATAGPAAVLNSIHPNLCWHDDFLIYDSQTEWTQENPGGRGFVFEPMLLHRTAGIYATITPADTGQLVFCYPILETAAVAAGSRPSDALSALLGAGRARALRAVGSGASTSELAARLGVKPSTASEHAAAIRAAGLIITVREGQSVRHMLTDLGSGLLNANSE